MATGETAATESSVAFPVQGWDRYEFQGFLGQGGMGRVYRAFDPRLKRSVALKFIRGEDPELNRRFLHEAQAQARVEHPHVCRVYEVGEVQGRLYIAMAFLDGRPLLEAARSMNLEQKVRAVRQVAEGLHAAHRLGLVHRDVKPQNVIVEGTAEGELHPWVMDFGLARQSHDEGLTATGTLLGTPWYMAPEQAMGRRQVDRRADVYSLGATLYELLCGRPPFVGAGPMEVLQQVLHDEPRPLRELAPGLPFDLEVIVLKCLEKEPERRYDSCRALADDLGRFLEGEPISARATTLVERTVRRARRNPALTAALAALLLALVGFGAFAVWSAFENRLRLSIAQELGQDAKEIEVLVRFASYTQPLHDVRRERALVRERLRVIGDKVRRLGAAAQGPGEYALGRGNLALGDAEAAYSHLKAAWDGGYRTPDVAYALGQAHTRLFQKGERDSRSLGSSEERSRRRQVLVKQHLEPALSFLEQARGVRLDAPEYLEAQVALLQREWERAIDRSAAALARAPWFYEARVLSGWAHAERAAAARDRGDTDAALADFGLGEADYRAAIDAARSDPEARAGLCLLFNQETDLELQRGGSPEERISRGLEICGQAAVADPERNDTLLNLSDLHWQRAALLIERGQDARPAVMESIAAAERALPSGENLAYAWDNLGIAYGYLADHALQHGGDPAPALDKAVGYLASCMQRYPTFVTCYCNTAEAELRRGDHALLRGRQVGGIAEGIRRVVERGLKVRDHFCLPSGLGAAELQEAQGLEASGRDPSPALARLARALADSRALNDALFENERQAHAGALVEARWATASRRSPTEALQRAEQALVRATRLNADDPVLSRWRGEIALVRARAEASAAAWAEAQRAFAEAVRRAPERFEPYLGAGRVACLGADQFGRHAPADLRAGMTAVGKALAIHPGLAEAFMLKACFERRLSGEAAARGLSTRALDLNPLLARAYPGLAQLTTTR